ncbi:hypothetical protein OG519_15870 [Streptomyces sp. NBC_01190]|nr:hypothetical protein OG519_15870 [Streptomyces sp. NBC_01190]
MPRAGHAEVEIVAASPGVARKVAEALRLRFAAAEERSYPAGGENGGTRLVLTVDTIHLPPTEGSRNLWLVGDERSRTAAARPTARGRGKRPPTPTPSPDEPSGDGPTP